MRVEPAIYILEIQLFYQLICRRNNNVYKASFYSFTVGAAQPGDVINLPPMLYSDYRDDQFIQQPTYIQQHPPPPVNQYNQQSVPYQGAVPPQPVNQYNQQSVPYQNPMPSQSDPCQPPPVYEDAVTK